MVIFEISSVLWMRTVHNNWYNCERRRWRVGENKNSGKGKVGVNKATEETKRKPGERQKLTSIGREG